MPNMDKRCSLFPLSVSIMASPMPSKPSLMQGLSRGQQQFPIWNINVNKGNGLRRSGGAFGFSEIAG
jgi:hypothetical protein